MFPTPFPGGPLDERGLIYDALADDGDETPPATDGTVPDEASADDAAADEGTPRTAADESTADDDPIAFACLGCATVTTAPDQPESCPACHRTPGDRRGGALFQRLD